MVKQRGNHCRVVRLYPCLRLSPDTANDIIWEWKTSRPLDICASAACNSELCFWDVPCCQKQGALSDIHSEESPLVPEDRFPSFQNSWQLFGFHMNSRTWVTPFDFAWSLSASLCRLLDAFRPLLLVHFQVKSLLLQTPLCGTQFYRGTVSCLLGTRCTSPQHARLTLRGFASLSLVTGQ